MMNVKTALSKGKVLLIVVPSASYGELELQVARELSGKNVCYVTLNKTHQALRENFTKEKVDTAGFVFVDAISKTIHKVPDQTDGCYFASSPSALTEISILVSKCLRHGFKYLVFDSLTSLMIYQDRAPVARFISNIANQVRASESDALFYTLDIESQSSLIKECSMMVDAVVKV